MTQTADRSTETSTFTRRLDLATLLFDREPSEGNHVTSVPLFVNGEGMRGGSVHPSIADHPFLGPAQTAPIYRFYSVGDRFPAMRPVAEGGISVVGELYDVPLDTLRDRFIPAEPDELELSVIEMADGSSAVAVVLRREHYSSPELTDISDRNGWRAYRSGLTTPH